MRAIKLPRNGLPSAWVLKQITFPPPKEYFQPRKDAFGQEIPPLISFQKQQEIRIACLMAGLDPVQTVGLPQIEQKPERITQPKKLTREEQVILDRVKRQKSIEENMAEMPQKIAEFRKARRENKQKSKSDLPF